MFDDDDHQPPRQSKRARNQDNNITQEENAVEMNDVENMVACVAADAMCDVDNVHETVDNSSIVAGDPDNATDGGTVHETSTSRDADLLMYLAYSNSSAGNVETSAEEAIPVFHSVDDETTSRFAPSNVLGGGIGPSASPLIIPMPDTTGFEIINRETNEPDFLAVLITELRTDLFQFFDLKDLLVLDVLCKSTSYFARKRLAQWAYDHYGIITGGKVAFYKARALFGSRDIDHAEADGFSEVEPIYVNLGEEDTRSTLRAHRPSNVVDDSGGTMFYPGIAKAAAGAGIVAITCNITHWGDWDRSYDMPKNFIDIRAGHNLEFLRSICSPITNWYIAVCGWKGCEVIVSTNDKEVAVIRGGASYVFCSFDEIEDIGVNPEGHGHVILEESDVVNLADRNDGNFENLSDHNSSADDHDDERIDDAIEEVPSRVPDRLAHMNPSDTNRNGILVLGNERHLILVFNNNLKVFTVNPTAPTDRVLTLQHHQVIPSLSEQDPALSISWGQDKGTDFITCHHHRINIWRIDEKTEQFTHIDTIVPSNFTPNNAALGDEYVLVSSNENNFLHVWDRQERNFTHSMFDHDGSLEEGGEDLLGEPTHPIFLCLFGRFALTTSRVGCALCLYDMREGTFLARYDHAENEGQTTYLNGSDPTDMVYLPDVNGFLIMEHFTNVWAFPRTREERRLMVERRDREEELS
mmetsp:Transcript_4495/g.9318  ORF Transcript_4495/g.9318 Transcript_4495/m.9318 type:complete len:695 (+) Transcript_4495:83-2167(+)